MTVLLKKAIKRVSSLSEKEQNELAQLILDEISDEEKWRYKFSKSQVELSFLASEAVKENNEKKTKPLTL
jgi:hypothetical protein